MRTSLFSILIGAAVICTFSGLASAYPEPTLAGKLNTWDLDVVFSKPQQISVNIPGDAKNAPARRFWYVILTVTNNTRDDVDFYPYCDLMTDTLKITPAGKKVMDVVFKKIQLIQQPRYPFIERLGVANNRILQGKDNAKDIAVIWPDFDGKTKKIDMFIGGLSNETVVIKHPVKKDKNGNPKKVYLQKTLQLKYAIGGNKKFRSDAKMKFLSKHWIMR